MKNVLSLFNRSFVLLAVAFSGQTFAASVTSSGYTNSFGAQPLAADFSTFSIAGVAADITTAGGIDAAVQLVSATSVTGTLVPDATEPPAFNTMATWSSPNGLFIQTRSTGNGVTLLMCTLVNNTSGGASGVIIGYDYAKAIVAAEDVEGHRAYYSLSGNAGSWIPIPEFSSANPGRLTATITNIVWTGGSALYVLWADDNGPPSPDTANEIDNFSAAAISATLVPVTITADPQNQTINELDPVTFTAAASGNPTPTLQWYTNNNVVEAAVTGATSSSLNISSVPLAYNGLKFKLVAQNTVSNVTYLATSTVATLTVNADTTRPVLLGAVPSGLLTVLVPFSERLALGSVTNTANYSITGAAGTLTISNAVLDASQTNIILSVSAMTPAATYTLTVNNVTDQSAAANAVLANSQASFTAAVVAYADIGSPLVPGSVTPAGNGYSISSGGTNISGTSDQFTFSYQLLGGDFDHKVRIQSLSGFDVYALAGLMARETLTGNSRFAASMASPSLAGCFFLQRATVGGNTTFAGNLPVNYPYTWVRLTRSGNTFTAYAGYDGQTWAQLGAATIALPTSIYVGYAVSGSSTSQVAVAETRDFSSAPGGTVVPTLTRNNVEPPGPSSRRSGLVITEIMYHPRARDDGRNLQYLEIFNSDFTFEDISGYRITGDVNYTFPAGTVLQAGSYLVVAQSPGDMQAIYGVSCFGPYIGQLSLGGGLVRLRNDRGAILGEVEYGTDAPWPLAADGAGPSLVLARPSYGEADPRAWAASDLIGGSPGRADSVAPEPLRNLVINEFLARTVFPAQDFIELYNHSTNSLDISGCWLSDNPGTNKFRIPDGTAIPGRGYAVYYESQLGFGLHSTGDNIFLVNSNQTRVLNTLRFGAQADGVATGRSPDGSDRIQALAAQTPGTTNAAPLWRDIVINEIMYDPISDDSDDEYVELYNRGTNAVNIGGWRFTAGIDYSFPTNTSMPSGAYFVVARNRNRILGNYPSLNPANVFGNYDGTLANGGERLAFAIRDTIASSNGVSIGYIVASEVTYGNGGRWSQWAHGRGSSLELIDSHGDNRDVANWTDSDETQKSEWVTINHQELLDHVYPVGSTGNQLNEFQIFILGLGEALVDDVEVHAGTITTGPNLVNNGTFSSLAGWLIQGNHVMTGLEPPGPNNPTTSLRLRASGGGDNGANRVESDLTATLAPNTQGSFTARARWLRGHREILFRLHGGGMEKVVALPVPTNLGTPGARNSRAVTNAGPAISAIAHAPLLPAGGQAVTVTAAVSDRDGVAQVVVRYRNDTASPTVNVDVPMNDAGTNGDAVAGDGIYTGTIPGQTSGNLVAFHVRATDGYVPAATASYPDAVTGHECHVRFGESTPLGSLGIYRLWMSASNMTVWSSREKLSNQAQEGTFVYGPRVIYGAGARYRGSPFIRPGYNTPTGNACAYVWSFPDDDLFLGQDECNMDSLEPSGRDSTSLREITSFNFVRQLGLPFSHQRFMHVILNGVNNASRGIPIYTDSQQPDGNYISSWFPDDDNGDIYKIDDWFEFDDTPAMQNNKSASLQNFTTVGGAKKQARYRNSWEKKFNGGYNDDYSTLFDAVNALNAPDPIYVQQVEGSFNIEDWMTVFAIGHTVGDWDRYGYNRGKNTFTYRPRNGKFQMLVWDLDFSIGCTGGHGPTQDLFTLSLGGDAGSDNMPEVSRLYNHPYFRRIYLRALQRIANGPLQTTNYMPLLDARNRALLANGVVATSPYVGSGAQGISLPAWIDQRRAYILTGSGLIPSVNFTITANNITVSSNLVTISGTAPVNIKTILINGIAWPATWTSTTAWSIRVPVTEATNQLQVVGLDSNNNPVTPTNLVTASFTGSPNPQGQVVINEIMYNPAVSDAEYVELFNTSSNYTFNLGGWELRGLDYVFPSNSFIMPRSFLVLAKTRVAFSTTYGLSIGVFGEYAGNLQNNGETLTLLIPAPDTNSVDVVIDKIRYDSSAPWPAAASNTGSSLQLIDVNQDNHRAGNWFSLYTPAVYCCGSSTPPLTNDGWRFVSTNGNIGNGVNTQMRLVIFLGTELGTALVDDISVVAGTNAEVGANYVRNGDFEAPLLDDPPFTNSWMVGTNYTNSLIVSGLTHTGNGALKLIPSTFGNSVSITATATNNKVIYQALSPAPPTGSTNTLSFWYWATNSATNLAVKIINSAALKIEYTNINIFITPSNFVPPQLVSPATNTLTPGAVNQMITNLPAFPPLWINELQVDNFTGIQDNQSEREPWVEIYNASTNTVSLDGLYLSPGYTNLTNWAFPPGSSIGPTQFLVVFCDGEPGETAGAEYHTAFRLGGSGSLALTRLFNNAPQVLDYVNYGGITPDLSYGSFPDGQPFDRMEFFYVTPRGTNDGRSAPLVVKINEWMASNVSALADTDGNFEDWFELYNPGSQTADLAGYYLTDTLTDKTKFLITTNMAHTIPPHGYLLVWADGEAGQNLVGTNISADLHVSFQLAKAGEALGLFAADGTPVDQLTFTNEIDNVSKGRCPDGAANIILMTNYTPRLANVGCAIGNVAPVLNPIGHKVVYLGQTLSFTATATDADLPPQTLTYSLGAGAPAGANIVGNTGAFSWTPSALVTNAITVRVTDNGSPTLDDSETITVEVIGAPGFSSSVRNGNNLEMTWGTRAGKKYAVDYTVDLNPPANWLPIQTNIAVGSSLSYTNGSTIGQKFFRIRTVD